MTTHIVIKDGCVIRKVSMGKHDDDHVFGS